MPSSLGLDGTGTSGPCRRKEEQGVINRGTNLLGMCILLLLHGPSRGLSATHPLPSHASFRTQEGMRREEEGFYQGRRHLCVGWRQGQQWQACHFSQALHMFGAEGGRGGPFCARTALQTVTPVLRGEWYGIVFVMQ